MMSTKFNTSNLFVELSTEEQQLLSGGQANRQPSYGGQPSYPSDRSGSRRFPTYVCRPVYGNDGSDYGEQ